MRSTALPVRALRARKTRLRLGLLVLLDIWLIVLGSTIAYFLRYEYEFWSEVTYYEPIESFLPTLALLVPTTLGLLYFKGFYRQPRNAGWLTYLGIVLSSVTTALTITIVITFLYKPFYYSRLIFALAWAAIVVLLGLSRLTVHRARHWRWKHGKDLERVLVVGGSGLGWQVMHNLQTMPSLGYDLVGYLHEQSSASSNGDPETPKTVPLLGSLA